MYKSVTEELPNHGDVCNIKLNEFLGVNVEATFDAVLQIFTLSISGLRVGADEVSEWELVP